MSVRRGREPGVGFKKGLSRRIVVSFDDETFEQIRQRAVRAGHSFGAEIRELAELGLETAALDDELSQIGAVQT